MAMFFSILLPICMLSQRLSRRDDTNPLSVQSTLLLLGSTFSPMGTMICFEIAPRVPSEAVIQHMHLDEQGVQVQTVFSSLDFAS